MCIYFKNARFLVLPVCWPPRLRADTQVIRVRSGLHGSRCTAVPAMGGDPRRRRLEALLLDDRW